MERTEKDEKKWKTCSRWFRGKNETFDWNKLTGEHFCFITLINSELQGMQPT